MLTIRSKILFELNISGISEAWIAMRGGMGHLKTRNQAWLPIAEDILGIGYTRIFQPLLLARW